MENTLTNKVSQSGLVNLNLENWYPDTPVVVLDIKPFLFMEMVVKEKEFRAHLKNHDWSQYNGKIVLIQCSVNTILPVWAKMLVAVHLEGVASNVFMGDLDQFLYNYYKEYIDSLDLSAYENERIVVKGCSKKNIPDTVFAYLGYKLKPIVKSIMFGEACSNVPVYKRKES